MSSRQALCRDYSDGIHPTMAVIRAGGLYHLVSVAQRVSPRQVVFDRLIETSPPRTTPREALCDLRTYMQDDVKRPARSAERLSPFGISFAWLLLAYGAVQSETALRLDIDPVRGLVDYVSQLAGEIRFIGGALLSCDPLAGEETMLDHLRSTVALGRMLPDPAWYCFEREQVEAGAAGALSLLTTHGGTRYRFFFDTVCGSSQDRRERLVAILVPLISEALGYSSLALDGCRSLFRRMWKMDCYSENWQPVHIRTLFGASTSVHYEHFLAECFEEACTLLPEPEGGEQ